MESASEVVLTVPAESSFVGLVRTATSAICAQADFTVDRLDDLRLAIDEACALAIADARPGSDLQVAWTVTGQQVAIEVVSESSSGRPVATNTFAWTVLTALVDEVVTSVTQGRLHIGMRAHGIESVAL
ncbi:MAG: ATP-binding protein [Candidatus Nanopelagicales bacterium]